MRLFRICCTATASTWQQVRILQPVVAPTTVVGFENVCFWTLLRCHRNFGHAQVVNDEKPLARGATAAPCAQAMWLYMMIGYHTCILQHYQTADSDISHEQRM